MTDRDHFAAAALTGLLAQGDDGSFSEESYARGAYRWADAMLRERERKNHDAAPAARASLPTADHAVCRGREGGCGTGGTDHGASPEARASVGRPRTDADLPTCAGTGDTPEIAAYRRFVGEVMNWISEATGFMHDDVLRTDDARDIITDACSRCWDAFNRIAYPTIHGAAPAAIASVDSVAPQPTTRGESDRNDKAAPRPSEGTGDTPKPIKGCVSDRPKPINGPDPDSRVWGTHTPATHATRGEGSVRREGTEPVAWAVCTPGDGDWSPCFFHEPHAQRCASAIFGSKNIVPLYRKPTLTDAEREALRKVLRLLREGFFRDSSIELVQAASVIDGLLERLGGER